MAVVGSGVNSEPSFKFLDKLSSSRYGCDVCQTIPASALKAQCCGAIYCQQCAELVQSSATIAGEQRALGSLVTGNPLVSTCTRCKGADLCLLPDPTLQESIDGLQVECPKEGCDWTGDFSAAEAHLKQPHDSDEVIYDNECPAEEPQDYDNDRPQDPGEEIYDNDGPLQPPEDPEEQIYDNDTPAQEPEEIQEDIYEEAPDPNDLEDQQIYDNEGPEVDRMSFTTEQLPPKPQPSTSSQPPSDYRAVAAETSQHEPAPGKTQQLQLSVEQGSLSSSGSHRENFCLRFYSRTHSGEFADLTTSEKLLYVMGFLTGSLWVLFVPPVMVISVLSGIQKLRRGDASIAPSCGNYSIALLLAVVVVHVVMATFLVCWFCKGSCKSCRGRRVNRATVSSLCLLALVYAAVVIGFSASVLAFVGESRSVSVADSTNSSLVDMGMSGNGSGSGEPSGMGGGGRGSGGECEGEMASGSGDMGSGNMTTCNNQSSEVQPKREEDCVEFLSESFILAVVFFGLLVIFVSAILCLLSYECSYNGFCYKREFYDPTVIVFENETSFAD